MTSPPPGRPEQPGGPDCRPGLGPHMGSLLGTQPPVGSAVGAGGRRAQAAHRVRPQAPASLRRATPRPPGQAACPRERPRGSWLRLRVLHGCALAWADRGKGGRRCSACEASLRGATPLPRPWARGLSPLVTSVFLTRGRSAWPETGGDSQTQGLPWRTASDHREFTLASPVSQGSKSDFL